MAATDDKQRDASVREGTELSGEHTDETGCVWCEAPVAELGDVCDIDCYSLLYAYMMRNSISGVFDWELLDKPVKNLNEQPWYESVARWSE